jgi:hypothetical protein
MTTANFESWTGTITDIGPIYPFVGAEMLFWILGVAFWIYWHVHQHRIEDREWEEELAKYVGKPFPSEDKGAA